MAHIMHNNHITPQKIEQPVYAKNKVHETQEPAVQRVQQD
jgi:hypothetical protein